MPTAQLWANTRVRSTPYTERIEAAGVQAYSVYNHTLLPLAFRSLVEDYRHLKQHVQLWDVSCQRQVEVRGPDAERLVQLMTPRDISVASPGRCLYTPLVDSAGGLVNDPVILKLDDDRFWLSIGDADVALWADGLATGSGLDVVVDEPEVFPLAVQGPKADELMARVFGPQVREIDFFRFAPLDFQGDPLNVARTGWSRQGGFEVYVDDASVGPRLWDALWETGEDLEVRAGCPNLIERIEGGLLSYGGDMTRAHNPYECGFERFCHVDRPIEFVGRAALEPIAAAGPTRRIVGLRIDADELPTCRDPWPVIAEDRSIGSVSSAAMSPDLGCGVAIATLDRSHEEPGNHVVVQTPDGPVAASVSSLPFDSDPSASGLPQPVGDAGSLPSAP